MNSNLAPRRIIQIGQRVHSGLYGGRDGIVYAIHGEQKPESIGSFAGLMSYGGDAEFDIVFEDGTESRMLPESILRGVQWRIYDQIATAEEIAAARGFVILETNRRKDEQQEKQRKHNEAVAALRSNPEYKHLTQSGQGKHTGAAFAAANIRAELKKAFPSIKFSVRSKSFSGGNSVDVGWVDGPLTADVKKIVDKYEAGHFNGMEDIYEYRTSAWTDVFGSAKYVSAARSHSVAAMEEAVKVVCKDFGWELFEVKTHLDGTAYVQCDQQDRYRQVYDFLEKRNHYKIEKAS